MAFGLVLIYYPILVYVNYDNWDGSLWGLERLLPAMLLGAVVIFLVFWGWLYAVKWLQNRLFRWFGEGFSLTMRWLVVLTTITICLALLVVFSNYSLDRLVPLLAPKQFFRVNWQYVIRLTAIEVVHNHSIGRLEIELKPASPCWSAATRPPSSRNGWVNRHQIGKAERGSSKPMLPDD